MGTSEQHQNTLHDTVLQRWKDGRVRFDYEKARNWVRRGPHTESAQDLLQWAEEHPFLKVNKTYVPEGIIPNDQYIAAYLYDIVVAPPRSRGPRVLDDDVYDAFPYLRKYVPRGLCILQLVEPGRTNSDYRILIYAMKKFTGGKGDEDEKSAYSEVGNFATTRWEHYFLEPVHNCVYFLETSKENGDAAHMNCMKIGEMVLYAFGSKNVHLLIRNMSDLSRYTDTRFKMAKQIAECLMSFFSNNKEQAKEFVNTLITKNYTATFELLNVENQHVELYPFKQSQPRFIAFTSNTELTRLCVDNIEESLQIARNAGLMAMTAIRHSYHEQDTVFEKIRKSYGKEGSVLYYFNEENKVIGLVKKKSIWYILVRAIREKMKGLARRAQDRRDDAAYMSKFKQKVRRTIHEKQVWLGFSEEKKAKWTELALKMADWLSDTIHKGKLDSTTVATKFPVVWRRFLDETCETDRI